MNELIVETYFVHLRLAQHCLLVLGRMFHLFEQKVNSHLTNSPALVSQSHTHPLLKQLSVYKTKWDLGRILFLKALGKHVWWHLCISLTQVNKEGRALAESACYCTRFNPGDTLISERLRAQNGSILVQDHSNIALHMRSKVILNNVCILLVEMVQTFEVGLPGCPLATEICTLISIASLGILMAIDWPVQQPITEQA